MKHGDSASVSAARVMWTYKGDVNSAAGENWEEPSSSILYQLKHRLMVIVMKKLVMQKELVGNNRK